MNNLFNKTNKVLFQNKKNKTTQRDYKIYYKNKKIQNKT